MKTTLRFLGIAGFTTAAIHIAPSSSHGQAYVNQANPGIDSVYLNQVPLGATPRSPLRSRPMKPAVSRSSSPASATVVAQSGNVSDQQRLPDVGTGSSAIVRSSKAEWPSVGLGAVNR